MKTTTALGALAVLTCLAAPAMGLNPLSRVNSREEAVEQFAIAEEKLNNQARLQELFDAWKEEYGITYPDNEEAYRLDVFENNVRRIIASNRNPRNKHWTGLTKFAAMTNEEFQSTLLPPDSIPAVGRRSQSRRAGPHARSITARATYPVAKDWSAEGKVTPVRNQGACGSCWAFAGTAAIEAKVKIATGVDYDFSEQQLVDCQTAAQACAGGWLDHPLSYATSTPLVAEAAYPYSVGSCSATATCSTGLCPTGSNGCRTCKTDKIAAATTTVKLSGYSWTPSAATKEVYMQAVATNGPLAIALQASDPDFQFYRGGILSKPQGTCGTSVNHAVLLVGYDSTGDAPYWRIKNSWGTGWGNLGYVDISMINGTVGSCQMYQYGAYFPTGATVSDTSNKCAGVSCPNTACKTGGVCDPATGQCTYTSFPTGPCTTSDNKSGQCDGQGTCQAIDLCAGTVCPSDACNSRACNPLTGQCQTTFTTNTCTTSDGKSGVCQSGTCVDLCAGVTCPGDECRINGACQPATGQCKYTFTTTACTTSDGSSAMCRSGVCTDLCAGVSCPDTACMLGGSCNPATGQCVYSSFPSFPTTCTTAGGQSGTCDGTGICQADLAGFQQYGIYWVGEVNRNCATTCQAAGNKVALGNLCSQSPTIIFPGTISSATCRGVKSTFSTYAITSGFGCGCINQGAQWTAGLSGACPAEAPYKQTFVCRTTGATGTYFGWTATKVINKVSQLVCTINVKDSKGRDSVAYKTAFDYLCTALPSK